MFAIDTWASSSISCGCHCRFVLAAPFVHPIRLFWILVDCCCCTCAALNACSCCTATQGWLSSQPPSDVLDAFKAALVGLPFKGPIFKYRHSNVCRIVVGAHVRFAQENTSHVAWGWGLAVPVAATVPKMLREFYFVCTPVCTVFVIAAFASAHACEDHHKSSAVILQWFVVDCPLVVHVGFIMSTKKEGCSAKGVAVSHNGLHCSLVLTNGTWHLLPSTC
jgi:hypothetical protein